MHFSTVEYRSHCVKNNFCVDCQLQIFKALIVSLQKSSSGEFKSSNKKLIRFGTNVDLSDWEKWGRQLEELEKLPKFLRVTDIHSPTFTLYNV